MFYVYMLTDPRKNNAPFYIGKGQRNRAYVHAIEKTKYNQFKSNVISAIRKKGMEHNVIIVKEFEFEQDSLTFEIELIKHYGRRGLDNNGILTNRTLGGEGTSGYKFTETQKQKLREAHLGKKDSDETKKNKSLAAQQPKTKKHAENIRNAKLGKLNPMFGKVSPFKGKTHTPETKLHIKEMRAKQVISAETKLKMAESQRRRHAARKINEFLK